MVFIFVGAFIRWGAPNKKNMLCWMNLVWIWIVMHVWTGGGAGAVSRGREASDAQVGGDEYTGQWTQLLYHAG